MDGGKYFGRALRANCSLQHLKPTAQLCIYVYPSSHIYIYIYISAYICISVLPDRYTRVGGKYFWRALRANCSLQHLNLRLNSLYTYIHLSIYIYIYISVYICISVLPDRCMRTGASTLGGRCERIARCSILIYGSTHTSIHVYIYIYTHLCLYMHLCLTR